MLTKTKNIIAYFFDNTLIVEDTNEVHANSRTVRRAVRIPPKPIMIRINISTGIVEISKKAIHMWCDKYDINKRIFITVIKSKTSPNDEPEYMGDIRVKFGHGVAGMTYTTAFVPCIRVQMKPETIENIVDSNDTQAESIETTN
ncbi:hypothetical protein V757_02245 [Pelistega indica]|uniref:Uncharacterized protein n=1 Tax=Pelistega indica TaxID=1414851 RepID=V8G8N2_9BURK|nr:hypothetical protein [Pelistega indica]ETD72780.1 hypothetical protein V757_02245 [Pelistega indica]